MTEKLGKVISVYSGKGGVSKTFLSVYLPLGIRKENPSAKVLVIDLDKNSHVGLQYGGGGRIEKGVYDWYTSKGKEFKESVHRFGNTNIWYMPSTSRVDKIVDWTEENVKINKEYYLKKLIDRLRPHFDYIFIDNHPSQNDSKTMYSILASDLIVVSSTPELLTRTETMKDIKHIQQIQKELLEDEDRKIELVISMNKVVKNKGDMADVNGFFSQLKEQYGLKDDQFLTPIRYSDPVKKSYLYQIFSDEKVRNNEYVRNVMDDVFVQSKEVMEYVEKTT